MGIKINKEFLPVKGQYFLFNAGTAPVVPFLPTYAKQLGFSSQVVGTIYTVLPVTGMLAKPFFGGIADRFNLKKAMFLSFQILTAVSFLSILLIPENTDHHLKMHYECDDGSPFLKHCTTSNNTNNCAYEIFKSDELRNIHCKVICPMTTEMWGVMCDRWKFDEFCSLNRENDFIFDVEIAVRDTEKINSCIFLKTKEITFPVDDKNFSYCPTNSLRPQCYVNCNSSIINDVIGDVSIDNSKVISMYQFWLFVWLLVISWIGMAVVVSVGDAICFEVLGDQPQKYGNQRLWGAVGWGLFSIIAGFLVDEMSKGRSQKDYSVVFYLSFVALLTCTFVSSKLRCSQSGTSASIIRDTGKLLKSPQIIIFILWCICVGLCTGLTWNFLFWYLEDIALQMEGCDITKWMKTLQGLVMAVQSFGGEIPFFFLSGWIIKKISHIHAMSLVLLGLGIRFILYSTLTNPWWVLPIELLQGLTFGLFYSTMASYAAIIAPPGTEATIQGLVGAVFEGIGVSLGSLLGGQLMDAIGGAATFRIYGIGALIACFLHIITQIILKRIHSGVTTNDRYTSPKEAVRMLSNKESI